MSYKKQYGFTIVELLVVIVVIGVLAAVAVVAYNGISGRAHDSAVQSDLRSIGNAFEIYKVDHGVYPLSEYSLSNMNLKVSKNSYKLDVGDSLGATKHNLVYCYAPETNPTRAALVAVSKSGKSFQYHNGAVKEHPHTITVMNSVIICNNAGVDTRSHPGSRIFFNFNGEWQPFAK